MAIGSSGSFGLVAAGGASTAGNAEDDRAADAARSFGDADALGPLPSPAAAVWWEGGATGGDCCSMTNRVFIIPFEGEHVHALRSRERGCFLVVQNSMGGKNSVNNRCRIAKHFRPK